MMKKCESQEEGERQYLTIYIGEGSKSLKEIMLKYNFEKSAMTDLK